MEFFDFITECVKNEKLEAPAENGKGDVQIEQAIGFLLKETIPFNLIDYGCGNGRLIEGIRTFDDECKSNLQYIGVNKEFPHEAQNVAKKYGIKHAFYTTDEYERLDIKAKYILLINVLHEIPLIELPRRLYHILKSLEVGGWVFIHEMIELNHGEDNFVSWKAEDIVQIFDSSCFEYKVRPCHVTRSGIPLTTLAVLKRTSTTVSLNDIEIKCHEIYRTLKNKIIVEINDLHKSKVISKANLNRLAYLTINNANIDRQEREVEQNNVQVEYCLLSDRIINPYDFEHPASGEQFYGREAELKRFRDAISEGRSIAIYGLQRIGKTSLVENILCADSTIASEAIIVRINMYEACETCLRYIDFFSAIVNGLCEYFGTEHLRVKEELSIFLRSTDPADLRYGFKNIISKVKKKLNKKRFILFIDEFQDIKKTFEFAKRKNITNTLDSAFIRFLSSLAKDNYLQLVICSRYQILEMDQEYNFQLLKLMTEIWLGVLDDSSAKNLIQYPVKNIIQYDSQAIETILVLTGCHPFLIQYLCYELIEKAKKERCGLVKKADVEYISKKLMAESFREPKFRVLYEDFQEVCEGKPWELLLIIAHYSKKCRQSISFDEITSVFRSELNRKNSDHEIQQYMKLLKNSRIVIEERINGKLYYYILCDMLRRWLNIQNYFERHF